MTTLNEAREAIYSRFLTNFTGVANSRVTFDNEDFTPGTGDWVRLSVRSVLRRQNTLGGSSNRIFRSQAMVIMQVYTAVNAGVKQADALAYEALGIFEGVSFSGLDFTDGAQIVEVGPDGDWYQINVEATFFFDEVK